ncbi:MAG: nitroreductase family protein [Desulfovibrio sp.]|nr:nitroreductase family protein [Desulfovibrio sp.]
MDIFTALHSRRSIRKYTEEPVAAEELRILLDAAMIAPSAGNAQPWRFVVIDDKTLLARIPAIHPYAGMAARAPLGIVVCGDLRREKYHGFWVQDCAAATQNLLLAATGLGLGAVWTGIYPVEDRVAAFSGLLNLPEQCVPLSLVVLGRPAMHAEARSRFDESLVHHNTFDGRAENAQV